MATAETGEHSGVVIRGGGLGDFVLTLPLVAALRARHRRLTLVTRPAYATLVRDVWLELAHVDGDGPVVAAACGGVADARVTELVAGAAVYSFLPDRDATLAAALAAAGARRVVALESRPAGPLHVAARMFAASGLAVPADLMARAELAACRRAAGPRLWLHPGSGSPRKNAPLAHFVAAAERWQAQQGTGLVVSFGDADLELLAPCRQALAGLDVEFVVQPTLRELRDRLAADAAAFLGNDSGVSHLAAALGLATTVVFRATDPAVWRPVGPMVVVVAPVAPHA